MMNSIRNYAWRPSGYEDDPPFDEYRKGLIRKDRILNTLLRILLTIFVVAFIFYWWLLFTAAPKETTAWAQREKTAMQYESSRIASDLIQVALEKYPTFAEKIAFLENEFNKKLEEYMKATNYSRSITAFEGFNTSITSGKELNSLFSQFVKGYNEFWERSREASSNYFFLIAFAE